MRHAAAASGAAKPNAAGWRPSGVWGSPGVATLRDRENAIPLPTSFRKGERGHFIAPCAGCSRDNVSACSPKRASGVSSISRQRLRVLREIEQMYYNGAQK